MHNSLFGSSLGLALPILYGCLAEAVLANPIPSPTSQSSAIPSCTPFRGSASSRRPDVASLILKVITYAPIALYAENLRVSSALVQSICSKICTHSPVTGCVKDIATLWNIRQQDIFEYPTFSQSGKQVVSLRHGNTFALVNAAVLDNAALIERGLSLDRPKPATEAALSVFRPTTVNITFLTPTSKPQHINHISNVKRFWLSYTITLLEGLTLLLAAAFLAYEGLFLGAVILVCPFASTALLVSLQHFSRPIFANKASIEKDNRIKASGGAAVDVHIVAANWNASELDVLIGYSSQLHALTNIPMRTNNPRLMLWMARILTVVLVTQASLLAASAAGTRDTGSGSGSDQTNAEAWGTLCWLVCYLLMLIPLRIFKSHLEDSLLDTQPFVARRLSSLVFSGRKDALCFIAGLPVSLRETVGRWDWVDAFMPPNARRREWEAVTDRVHARIKVAAVTTSEADGTMLSDNTPPNNKVSEWEEKLYLSVQAALEGPFKDALGDFMRQTGLTPAP
ncbi:uncharacterized protein APUU_31780S [Aspergillus puulaauensis]|uniref:Uncharacterized protein n=1 Tax=Aspergillus puulaauensis TaxID=1220207 RepID=A0A7R7XL85_9EURO|nr:uncharacterized protein APUU_31780S [Aspergillus puulaauensis]BCS23556.1 hypothetical protein APUU_31780S [Aspergillus puulaauensis]